MTAVAALDRAVAARRRRLSWGVSGAITAIWLLAVLASGLLGRVLDHWASTITMLFGSFLAGSSPEGGGAVAFPVFTKALGVSAPVARSFGLCIQAVGMSAAAASIVLFRRPIHARALVVGTVAALGGFTGAVVGFGRPEELFWPSSIGTPWVKATFSILLATTSVLMLRHLRHGEHRPLVWNRRLAAGLAVVAAGGGVVSALAGTGANILVFLFLVVVVGVDAKVALPTAIVVMAVVSVAGLTLFGLVDGQLDVTVVDGVVTEVGGTATALPASESDLLGLWLAAVPVVAWGAPLGSLAASLVREHHLVWFVAVLATVEVVTTVVLVPELRSQPSLVLYLLAGLAVLPTLFIAGQVRRHTLFA